MPTLRTMEVDPTKNDEALEINLDLIEEKREQAAIQEAKSKTKMEKYLQPRVRGTSNLGPKWRSPYEGVDRSLGNGASNLKINKGNERSSGHGNICILKVFNIHESKTPL
ncbi:hypothetical protein Tco_0889954 [Tanacetum coccineum]